MNLVVCGQYFDEETGTHYDAGCAGEVEGLAALLQPSPPARFAWPPDPKRIRQKEVRSTTGKSPNSSFEVTGYVGNASEKSHLGKSDARVGGVNPPM